MKSENKHKITHTPANSKIFIGKNRIKINDHEIFGVTAINIDQKDYGQKESTVTIKFRSKDVVIEDNSKVGISWVAPEIND